MWAGCLHPASHVYIGDKSRGEGTPPTAIHHREWEPPFHGSSETKRVRQRPLHRFGDAIRVDRSVGLRADRDQFVAHPDVLQVELQVPTDPIPESAAVT